LRGVNFTLHAGEILGIAGMIGAGRTELLRAIFGADPVEAGEIVMDGETLRPDSPRGMTRRGLALAPEDRKAQALVLPLSIRANVCLASLHRVGAQGLITRRRERAVATEMAARLAIKLGDPEDPVESLSGGNQQKVVVGKWLGAQPRVMLFDEPTRGIDVQAKQKIFQIIWDLSRAGISSIFVSSELEELIEVCHRILIMKHGAIAGEVDPATVTADELTLACMEQ
jgi:ABC-type sugar transport system ATPase subunit